MKFALKALAFILLSATLLHAEKQVLFIVGKPSHGPGEHQFPDGSNLLAKALNESGLGIHAIVSLGWPQDESAITTADTIVLYSDGLADHVAMGHLDQLRRHMEAGKGLAVLHFALEPSDPDLQKFLNDAIGGYFEVDWSVNPVWTIDAPILADNPVSAGVNVQGVNDEFYYHLRFRDGITPILQALPPEKSLKQDGPRSGNPAVRKDLADKVPQTLAWIVENKDGSRGFGFTGGHFHYNWANDGIRRLVLNGIVWTARINIPAAGVQSTVAPIARYLSIDKAIAAGDIEDVRRQLALTPASLNEAERKDTPPLHQAILRNKTDIAILLIDSGADLNATDASARTPLHLAVERKNPIIAKKLLEKRADPGLRDKTGWTPLHHAAAKNLYDIGVILIEGGANPMALSERGGTPLHEAAASADARFIQLLLDNNVDPSIVSLTGVTALDIAREFKNQPAIDILSKVTPAPPAQSGK